MILVRPAVHEEREQLVELALHFSRTVPVYDGFFAELDDDERRLAFGDVIDRIWKLDARSVILVAVVDEVIVGGLALIEQQHEITGQSFCSEVAWWVEPGARAHRAGPYMLRAACDWAVQRGLKNLKMVAPIPSAVGRFYERMGFQPFETAYLKVL